VQVGLDAAFRRRIVPDTVREISRRDVHDLLDWIVSRGLAGGKLDSSGYSGNVLLGGVAGHRACPAKKCYHGITSNLLDIMHVEGRALRIRGWWTQRRAVDYSLLADGSRARTFAGCPLFHCRTSSRNSVSPEPDLVTVGYGKTKPKDPNDPMDPANRRVRVVNMANKTASN
jgi:hypothetical protein